MTLVPVDVVAIFGAVLLANLITLAVAGKLVQRYLLGPPVDPADLEGEDVHPDVALAEREESGADLDLEDAG